MTYFAKKLWHDLIDPLTARRDGGGSGGGLAAGAIAAAIATGGMLGLAQALAQPSLPETIAQAISTRTPITVIEGTIKIFGDAAKHLLLAVEMTGQIAVGSALGFWMADRGFSRVQRLAALTVMAAVVGLVALPALGVGILGANSRSGAAATSVNLAVGSGLFFVCYAAMMRYLNPTGMFAPEDAASRRALIRNGLLTFGTLAVGVGGFRWLAEHLEPAEVVRVPSAETLAAQSAIAAGITPGEALSQGVPGLAAEITPTEKFYVVSKNILSDPTVDAGSWRLEIGGDVNRPLTFTYDQIKRLPSANQFLTLQCISNPVGGDLMGNAEWRGVPLADLLRQAEVQPGAVDVILRAADDYSESIPIAKALDRGTMLAYEMNGQVLPKIHGFPARLLVPDIYGMKNVKWITKIEVVGYDFKGYWQQQGWSDVAVMNTTSRIDFPRPLSPLPPGPNYIGGVAVAGARGIKRVEVSTDGGQSWAPAVMKPPMSLYSWVLWLYEWAVPTTAGEGYHQVLVRATDGTGAVQTAVFHDQIPDGATGLHSIVVRTTAV